MSQLNHLQLDELKSFLQTQTISPFTEEIWISLTVPIYKTEDEFTNKLKSQFKQAISLHPLTTQYLQLDKVLLPLFLQQAIEWRQKNTERGTLLMFLNFSPEQINRRQYHQVSDMIQIILSTSGASLPLNIRIGKIFDLTDVIRSENKTFRALVAIINQNKTEIFLADNIGLEQIRVIDNPYISEEHNRYIHKYSIQRSQSLYHGTGSEKNVRQQQAGDYQYLQQVGQFLKNKVSQDQDTNYVLIFYPHRYTEEISSALMQQIQNHHHFQILTENKNIPEFSQLHQQVSERIKADMHNRKSKLLQDAQNQHYLFETDLKKVVDSVRDQKVARLFISPDLHKPGYVINQELLFTYPTKGSKKVHNLTPWIINSLTANSGEVRIINQIINRADSPIAATLRY